MLEAPPSKEEIFETLLASNLKAAAGTDGIPGLLYKVCWEDVGETLIDVIHELFRSKSPTVSMRTALMVFSSKPKNLSCFKPSSKRRISILNTNFKLYEGLISRRFRKLGDKAFPQANNIWRES